MENAVINPPADLSTLRLDDREVFERVWRRVMPEGSENAPIVVEASVLGGDLPCACSCVCPQTAVVSPLPALREGGCPHLGCDFPDTEDVPCLGRASARHQSQLQQQISDALECWQIYRCLARRAGGGSCGRMLSSLASEKHKTARRLAAAHFLISGVRFWPMERLSTPSIPSYLGTVRTGYQREQQREQAYRMAAADTNDTALAELYQDLSNQSRDHSQVLRTILEQSHM